MKLIDIYAVKTNKKIDFFKYVQEQSDHEQNIQDLLS